MGLIEFVKEAGAKLGLGKSKEEAAEEAAVEEYIEESTKANALWHLVRGLGLEIENLNIQFDDGTATVTGTTETQAEREKVVLAVGNVEGVARVDDQITVVAPEPAATFYTVVSGDTLSGISLEHYGNAMKYTAIFEANRPMLENPDLIYPGQVLRIPPLEG
jgi:nucleoid-associated protein YgaU